MTNDDDMIIRKAAREICSNQAAQRDDEDGEIFYLLGVYTNQLVMRLVEKGIRKGIEIGRSL
jgi:hypothetical protein